MQYGGYTSGRKELVDWLRNRSRPYLFSKTLSPTIASASIKVLDMLEAGGELRKRLKDNSEYFRTEMTRLGFELAGADHPIIPVMLGDASLAGKFADKSDAGRQKCDWFLLPGSTKRSAKNSFTDVCRTQQSP